MRNEKIRSEIDALIQHSESLLNFLDDRNTKFDIEYQVWYTKSYEVIRQLIPNRLGDFTKLYDNDKSKISSYIDMGINRYLLKEGVPVNFVKPKLIQQIGILKSTSAKFDSILLDIKTLVQADIFDSEIESSKFLLKKGFYRASGTVCGVVIEKHLKTVCNNNNIPPKKKHMTIADFNDELKNNDIITSDAWRFIQYLADLRNLCSHNKDREPSQDDVQNLISGTERLIKTIF